MANMHVCPKHRDQLGRFFRPLRSCQYPLHNGPARKCHGRVRLKNALRYTACLCSWDLVSIYMLF